MQLPILKFKEQDGLKNREPQDDHLWECKLS